MSRFLLLLFVAAVAGLGWYLFIYDGSVPDETEGSGNSAAVVIPDDEEGTEGEGPGTAGGTDEHGRAPDPDSSDSRSRDAEGGGVQEAAAGGERALAAWHRARPEDREHHVAGFTAEQDAALDGFADLWLGEADRYQAALKLEVPDCLGPAFARLAKAFADDGRGGLDQALGREINHGPAWLAWNEGLAVSSVAVEDYPRASRALETTLRAMLRSGYDRERVLLLKPTIDVLGERPYALLPFKDYKVVSGDSLIKICRNERRAGNSIWYGWVMKFNRKRNDNIRLGETLKLPTTPLRIEVWRKLRLQVVFAGDHPVRMYDVSVGVPSDETPLGEFTIAIHERDPVHWRKDADPLPFGHPENPLGTRWLGFQEDTQYGIHGTNSEDTIGSYETLGCVRMHNVEVEELFDWIPDGTKVRIHP